MSDILESSFLSALTGGVGCFLAPASAAAAGGVLPVMGACALGTAIVYTFSPFDLDNFYNDLWSMLSDRHSFKDQLACSLILSGALLVETCLSALIGAHLLNIAVNPVFVCSAISSSILLACLLVPTVLPATIEALLNLNPWSETSNMRDRNFN